MPDINKKLISENIIKMADEDQKARIAKDAAQMKKIDRKNRIKAKKLINTIGYISKNEYGEEAAHKMWLLIQHFGRKSVYYMEKYLDLMKANSADPKDIAMLEDRVRVYNKKPQIYGSQAYSDPGGDRLKFREIEDIKNVDELRGKIGMPPLKEYAELLSETFEMPVDLPEGYKS